MKGLSNWNNGILDYGIVGFIVTVHLTAKAPSTQKRPKK